MRPEVRALLTVPAGPQLAAAVAALEPGPRCPMDHAPDAVHALPVPGRGLGIPCACQVVIAAAWEACASWAAAGATVALVDAAGEQPAEIPVSGGTFRLQDPARDELAPALRCSANAMANRLANARGLAAQPQLLGLVSSAAISPWAARNVASHLEGLEPELAARVVAEVADRIGRRRASGRCSFTSAEVNRVARAARLRVAPEAEAQARARAFGRRRVVVQPGADGMATLIAELAEVDAHRIHRRLGALARGITADTGASGGVEPRTADQLRADLLVDLLLGAAAPRPDDAAGAASTPPAGSASLAAQAPGAPDPSSVSEDPLRPQPSGPDISVIISLEALLGLAQTPATVPGIGPIPAEVARALAADGTWRAWVADARGAITATGSRGYVPSAAVARLVRAREPHCRFPGCRQPAHRCDLDHTIPYPRGATTSANLGPLCRRHHNLKTSGAFDLEPGIGPAALTLPTAAEGTVPPTADPPDDPPMGWTWRTPAGITVRAGPEPPLA
jgi:hypothetical protein